MSRSKEPTAPTAMDRIERIGRSVLVIEGLHALLDVEAERRTDTSEILLAARHEFDAIDAEMTWLREYGTALDKVETPEIVGGAV